MRLTDPTGRVRAAGGVLWRGDPRDPEVALVHRPRYDDWTLPKGHVDAGEHDLVAAFREVREETGVRALPGRPLGHTDYVAGGRPKRVRWWAAQQLEVEDAPDDEVDELAWCAVADAVRRLDVTSDRALVRRLVLRPVATVPVALVRHAHAGSRQRWRGDDDERPLSGRGRAQALALVDPLALLGPALVRAAGPVRCRATLEPLAAAAGVDVAVEERLAEAANRDDAVEAAHEALAEVLAAGEPAVLCSQGGVLPTLLARVLSEHGVRPVDRACVPAAKPRKASTTVLHVADGRVVAAEHHATLAPRT